MTVSAGEQAPVELGVGRGAPLRVALVHGRHEGTHAYLSRVALASSADVAFLAVADEHASLVETAQRLRDAAPAAVLVGGEPTDARGLALVLEALRLGCAEQRPRPCVFAFGEARVAEQLRPASRPFAMEHLASEPAGVAALRALRRRGDEGAPFRDEILEDAARSLAAKTGADALVVDVSEGSSSCVLARAAGQIDAAHVAPLGIGEAADRLVAAVGLDRVRRWLPWPIDAPALLERVFNRSRWPGAVPATPLALAMEMALAREAIGSVLRASLDAGFDVAAMRAAPNALVTGRAATFPRTAQSLLVFVDGVEPTRVTAVWREPEGGHAERIALVASLWPRRASNVRVEHRDGRDERRIGRGDFALVPVTGEVELVAGRLRVHGDAGSLGVLIDARGRPLELPHRDAERLPVIASWHGAAGAFPGGPPRA